MRTQTFIEKLLAILVKDVVESPFLRNAEMYDWNLFRRDRGNSLAAISPNTTLQAAQIENGAVCELHAEIKRAYGTILPSSGVYNLKLSTENDPKQIDLRQQFYEEYIKRKKQKED
jgi:hypothetical protein